VALAVSSAEVSLTAKPTKGIRRFYVILVVAVLTLAIIIGISIFLLGVGNSNYGPGPVNIEVTAHKPFYLQGEEAQFSIYVNNEQNWKVPRPHEVIYQIEKDGDIIDGVTVSIDFAPGLIPTFPARSRTQCNPYVWDQTADADGNRTLVQPGNYTFTVIFGGLVDYGDGGSCIFEIRTKPQP
jgi:hypothetical protein